MFIYENGFPKENKLGFFDLYIRTTLYSQLDVGDAFINLTWVEDDRNLANIFNCDPKNLYLYSGVDPHYVPPFLENHLNWYIGNIYHVGNYSGERYFFWWLHYLKDRLHEFVPFNPYDISNDCKIYMNLNRKPHPHRQKLVRTLIDYNLLSDGHVSLGQAIEGFTNEYDLPLPLLLENDVVDKQGDGVIYGDVGITNNIYTVGSKEYWNSHIVNIVTETWSGHGAFISEKTIKPILGRRPFMVYGDNQIYNVLKSIGIDTFDDLFGTFPHDKNDRAVWICENLVNLKKDKHLNKLILSLKPRLEANYNTLLSYIDINARKLTTLLSK